MARQKTFSGEVVTITETKASDASRHWFIVQGSAQGVLDYLNENGIPEHKVKGFHFNGTIFHVLFHK